jgi:hypothetical protein
MRAAIGSGPSARWRVAHAIQPPVLWNARRPPSDAWHSSRTSGNRWMPDPRVGFPAIVHVACPWTTASAPVYLALCLLSASANGGPLALGGISRSGGRLPGGSCSQGLTAHRRLGDSGRDDPPSRGVRNGRAGIGSPRVAYLEEWRRAPGPGSWMASRAPRLRRGRALRYAAVLPGRL